MDVREWIYKVDKFLTESYDNTFINRLKRKIQRKILLSTTITYSSNENDKLVDWLYCLFDRYYNYNTKFLLFRYKKYLNMISHELKTSYIKNEVTSLSSSMIVHTIDMTVPGYNHIKFQWDNVDKETDIFEDGYSTITINKDTIDQRVYTVLFPRFVAFYKELLKDFYLSEKNKSNVYIDDVRCFSFSIQTTANTEYDIELSRPEKNNHITHSGNNTYTDIYNISATFPIEVNDNQYYFEAKIGIAVTYMNINDDSDISSPYVREFVEKMVREYKTKNSGYIYDLINNTAIDLINVKSIERFGVYV